MGGPSKGNAAETGVELPGESILMKVPTEYYNAYNAFMMQRILNVFFLKFAKKKTYFKDRCITGMNCKFNPIIMFTDKLTYRHLLGH